MYIIVTAHRLQVLLCSSQALSKSPPSYPIRRGLNSCIASYVIAFATHCVRRPSCNSRKLVRAKLCYYYYVLSARAHRKNVASPSRLETVSRVFVLSATCAYAPRRIPRACIVPRFGCTYIQSAVTANLFALHIVPPAKRFSSALLQQRFFALVSNTYRTILQTTRLERPPLSLHTQFGRAHRSHTRGAMRFRTGFRYWIGRTNRC